MSFFKDYVQYQKNIGYCITRLCLQLSHTAYQSVFKIKLRCKSVPFYFKLCFKCTFHSFDCSIYCPSILLWVVVPFFRRIRNTVTISNYNLRHYDSPSHSLHGVKQFSPGGFSWNFVLETLLKFVKVFLKIW